LAKPRYIFEKPTEKAEKPERVSTNQNQKLKWQIFIVNIAAQNARAFQV